LAEAEWQTRRLLARKPTPEDRASYHSHFTHPTVERWLRPSPLPPFNAQVIDELIEGDCAHWSDHGFGPWVLVDKETSVFVGRGGLAWTSVEGIAVVSVGRGAGPGPFGPGGGPGTRPSRDYDFDATAEEVPQTEQEPRLPRTDRG
jgi:hypothetical protein